MYKIGVVGDRGSIRGFSALGFVLLEAQDANSAREVLHRAAKSGEYAVLFIVDALAAQLEEEIEHYRSALLPAITPIPGCYGTNGYGAAAMRQIVERAVGSDILPKD